IRCLIFVAAAGVTDSRGVVSMRSWISIAASSYPTVRTLKSPDFVTLGSGTVEPFPTAFVAYPGPVRFRALEGRHGLLDNWLPFLIYGAFALAIPASMIYASFAFAPRPHRRTRPRQTPL